MAEEEQKEQEQAAPEAAEPEVAEAGDETSAEAEVTAPAAAEQGEPAEKPSPKQLRKRTRSTSDGAARAPRTPEERAAERAERRAKKAEVRRAYRSKQREQRRASGGAATQSVARERAAGTQKQREGVVVSDKADKTITVRIDQVRRHRAYKKVIRRSTTLSAHDESNEAGAGDVVRIVECRPLSATKRWRLVEVVKKAR